MKKFLGLVLAFVAGGLGAQEQASLGVDLGGEFQLNPDFATREEIRFTVDSPLLDLVSDLSMNSDGKYGADIANFRDSKTFFNNYFLMEEGYLDLDLKPVSIRLGRSKQREAFSSPYSLFLNSTGPSANGAVIRYVDRSFEFESRWIELNSRSDFGDPDQTPESWRLADGQTDGTGFPDRGVNLKTFVFKFGTMRLGLQDAAVYTGRSFDWEYFVNPIPEYFTQYYKTTAGRPWTTSGNENNLIGAFWDWKEATFSLGAQVLIDDFSLYFLFPAEVPNNPWKAAWSLGGSTETSWGQIGFYHAGALKYTFAPITTRAGSESVSAYGYTLYPSNEYFADGAFRSLAIEDNALGYQHGENNLAIMVTWAKTYLPGIDVSSSLELILAGENSPTNPWHDDDRSNEVGTHWLDDGALARTLIWKTGARWSLNDWSVFAELSLGYRSNLLKLTDAESDSNDSSLDRFERIWRPSTSNEGLFQLILGATWHWDISSTLGAASDAGS